MGRMKEIWAEQQTSARFEWAYDSTRKAESAEMHRVYELEEQLEEALGLLDVARFEKRMLENQLRVQRDLVLPARVKS